MTTLLVIAILALAVLGAPIVFVFLALSLVGLAALPTNVPTDAFGYFSRLLESELSLATGDISTTLSTIPLFIFAGTIMAHAGTAKRLVNMSQAALGWLPGGLGIVTIFTCALFTTFTGASGVTIVAIGGLLMPELLKQGYRDRFALGLVTGSGAVGLLFPPALPLIVYASVYVAAASTGQAGGDDMKLITFSAERFYTYAGLVPGLVLVLALSGYVVYTAVRTRIPRTKLDLPGAARAFVIALPELLIPVLVIASLATGTLRVPQAAAFTAAYVLLVEMFVYRDVKLRHLPKISREAMSLVGAIYLVIIGATALTQYFTQVALADKIFAFITTHIESKWAFLLALNLMLLVVGCLMDIFAAILVVVPLITPVAAGYGIDPYHLGIVFLLNLEIGYLTPPVGLNLFISSFRFGRPMPEVVRASAPFLLIMMIVLVAVTYIPALVPVKDTAGSASGAASSGSTTPAAGGDAGPVVITWPDGGVWTPARCDAPEIKDDPLALAECKNVFANYAKCAALEVPLDRLECEQRAMTGESGDDADAGPIDAGALDAGTADSGARP